MRFCPVRTSRRDDVRSSAICLKASRSSLADGVRPSSKSWL
ncbi:MAG: hypothetical protein ACREEM_19990 [Blastocatellia bacterium]